jgi:homoserine dehydrogenase
MAATIRLGLLGVGTVGSAVVRTLAERSTYLQQTTGRSFEVHRALVRDLTKPRDVPLQASAFTSDVNDVLLDDSIDVVVELIGEVEPANTYLRRAIKSGKHVVTANKEVMATHGVELLELAAEHDRDLYFEATVGGGIPLIGPFRQDLAANQIREVHAILNGTTNFILTQMAAGDSDYESALAEAQKLGYAEPSPENDVEGHDSACKLAILASLAFKSDIRSADVFREGITNVSPADFRHASDLGYSIKLLAIAKAEANEVEVRVHPTLVQKDFLLSQVDGVFNAVRLDGDLLGRAMFIGRGAGPEPTSSAIVADLIDLGHNIHRHEHNRIPISFSRATRVRPMAEVRSRYYFRVWVQDHPGVLAQIGTVCGEESVSIASVIQKEVDETAGRAELVFLTHEADECSAQQAIARIAELEVVAEVASCIRVENLAE